MKNLKSMGTHAKAHKSMQNCEKARQCAPKHAKVFASTPKHSKHSVAFKRTQKHTKMMTFSHLFENFVTTFSNLLLLQIINFTDTQTHRLKYFRAPEVDLS
jgi:hypothetical protein